MFNPFEHYLSKMPPERAQNERTKELRLWLGNSSYDRPKKNREVSEHRMIYEKITAATAEELSGLFERHLQKIMKENATASFMSLLGAIELIGVQVSPISHQLSYTGKETLPRGILVNETKNTLAIFLNGAVKVFPKAMYNFLLYIDQRQYFIIGPALKHTRRYA